MTRASPFLAEDVHRYILDVSVAEPDILARLRAETAALPQAHYQIAPEQGQILTFILRLLNARRTLDIGTFTGYSALTAALAVGSGGHVVTCDTSLEWTGTARRYWQEAGVDDRIELKIAPASETLDALLRDGAAGTFDFIFIDADKENYPIYLDRGLDLLRAGGVVAIDNTLWRGRVLDTGHHGRKAEIMRALNRRLRDDPHLTQCLLPFGDGLTLAVKHH